MATKLQAKTRSTETAPRAKPRGKFRIFISYKREDQYIANVLRRILESIDPSISCFFDQDIEEGSKWAEEINKELVKSDWLILIYTGNHKNYEMCVYEVATFQALHQKASQSALSASVTCLHDTQDMPSTFKPYQNCRIMALDSEEGHSFATRMKVENDNTRQFYAASPCGQFLKRLTETYHKVRSIGTDSVIEDIVSSRAEELTKAFVHASDPAIVDKFMYPRMWLEFDPPTIAKIKAAQLTSIPDETPVAGDDTLNALNIFGLDENKSTWGQIRAQCKKSARLSSAGWLAEMDTAILSAVCDETVRSIELGFRSIDTRAEPDIYRCILTRRTNYRSGRQLIYLLFVRSRNRKLANDDAMALHLALLVMAMRFRFEVLKGPWSFRFENESAKFDVQANQFLRLIEKAEYESEEFGVMNALANAFSEDDQKTIEKISKSWNADLDQLEKVVKDPQGSLDAKRTEVLKFIDTWVPVNGSFLQMVTESFLNRLKVEMKAS